MRSTIGLLLIGDDNGHRNSGVGPAGSELQPRDHRSQGGDGRPGRHADR